VIDDGNGPVGYAFRIAISVQFLQHAIPVAATNGYTSVAAGSMTMEERRMLQLLLEPVAAWLKNHPGS
jgi:hypothetical protein